MKQITNLYEDYISLKTQGKEVIALPSVLGANVSLDVKENFTILWIGSDSIAHYEYIVQDGHFYISKHEESIDHNLKELISSETLDNQSIVNWWNAVFYRQNNEVSYDEYYDSLRIAENSQTTFREYLDSIEEELRRCEIKVESSCIFVTGKYGICPLIVHAIDELFNETDSHSVRLLEMDYDTSRDEKDYVDTGDSRLDTLTVSVNHGLVMRFLLDKNVRVNLPVTDVVLQSEICPGIQWNDMLPENIIEDYTACNYKFKYLDLSVNCDAFRNLFLTSVDIYDNKVVKLI